jgi:hypothetical protein
MRRARILHPEFEDANRSRIPCPPLWIWQRNEEPGEPEQQRGEVADEKQRREFHP